MNLNLDLRGFEVVYELSLTRRLFSTLEEQLLQLGQQTAEDFRQGTPVDDEEDYLLLCSTLSGLEREAEHQRQTLFSTEVIQLHVLFEGHLKFVCKAVAAARGLNLEIANFSGSLVDRGRLFLGDYSGILPKGHSIWAPIGMLHRLRNYLVHAAVEASSKDRKAEVAKLAKSCQKFNLLVDGELVLSRPFCDYLHDGVKEFFSQVFDALGWRAFKQ